MKCPRKCIIASTLIFFHCRHLCVFSDLWFETQFFAQTNSWQYFWCFGLPNKNSKSENDRAWKIWSTTPLAKKSWPVSLKKSLNWCIHHLSCWPKNKLHKFIFCLTGSVYASDKNTTKIHSFLEQCFFSVYRTRSFSWCQMELAWKGLVKRTLFF